MVYYQVEVIGLSRKQIKMFSVAYTAVKASFGIENGRLILYNLDKETALNVEKSVSRIPCVLVSVYEVL